MARITNIMENINLEVRLWGQLIGRIVLDQNGIGNFRYADDFGSNNWSPSPLVMPVNNLVYRFPNNLNNSFHGLPGLVSDSLPDSFGSELINLFFKDNGLDVHKTTVLHRLAYVGTRGMGALEYQPSLIEFDQPEEIELDHVYHSINEVLNERFGNLQDDIKDIIHIGSSVGGARPKVLLGINKNTEEIRPGNLPLSQEYDYHILKIDALRRNNTVEISGPIGYSNMEYAFYLMATACGIPMMESRLLQENDRNHFLTKRFDRINGEKLHIQSLSALTHEQYSETSDYMLYFRVIQHLRLPYSDQEDMFRRMVFNVFAGNTDDHIKNTSFIMDKAGKWSLAPAYDLVFCYNPQYPATMYHKSAVNGKTKDISKDDLVQLGKKLAIKSPERICEEVGEVLSGWKKFGQEADVKPEWIDFVNNYIQKKLV